MKVYHHNDLDGRAAGAVVAFYERDYRTSNYIEVDYMKPLPIDDIKSDEQVYIVDYSFTEGTIWQLAKILEVTKNVVWIDHHTSSLELLKKPVYNWAKNVAGIREDNISGAALAYMYFYDCSFEDVPYPIKLVSDYDCWIYKYNPDTTWFKLGMDSEIQSPTSTVWVDLLTQNVSAKSTYNKISYNGSIIKSFIDRDNADYLKKFGYESEICGMQCYVVNRKSNSWIFGNKINEYPVVVVWAFDGNKYSYSIFSEHDSVDCSKIAESFGGGGHKGAAGFASDELLFKARV